jgi:AcrR family transcriptional regulator
MIAGVESLPLLEPDSRPRERADAARNRLRILAAAAELVDERGIAHVSMDDVARAACVGTGTLYRRFGDRAGLALALLDEQTRAFQDALISGPPPLGPGAPPVDRLVAYGTARIRFLAENHEIARSAIEGRPTNGRRPPLSQIHIRVLLRELDLPGADVDLLAGQLTSALEGPLLLRLFDGPEPDRSELTGRFEAGWRYLVERVCLPAA